MKIAAAAGHVVTSVVLSLLVALGGVAAQRCFDAGSPFETQGCTCNLEVSYMIMRCPFWEGELPSSMSQTYSNVGVFAINEGNLRSLNSSNLNFYPNLKLLIIQNTALQHIGSDTFTSLSLRSLVLDNNRLTNFPPVANLTELAYLSVQGNDISSVTKADLLNTRLLTTLLLDNNHITELPVDVFENNCQLKNLSLSGNAIHEFKHGTFNGSRIASLDLSFTLVEQLPTDGIRNYLSEINLQGATNLDFPSFTTAQGDLTYPLLHRITMPFHAYCCQLNSKRIRPFKIKLQTVKQQGALPQPSPSSTSLQGTSSSWSQIPGCSISTVVQVICTTKVALSTTNVDIQKSIASVTKMTFFPLGEVTSTSAVLTPSPYPSVTASYTIKDVPFNYTWSAAQGASYLPPVMTVPLSSELVSHTSGTSSTQNVEPTTAFIPIVTTITPDQVPFQPSVASPLHSYTVDIPVALNSTSDTVQSFTVMPTDVPSATPMVSCYTETSVVLCCNTTTSAPTNCEDLCDNNPLLGGFCPTCLSDGCQDPACLSLAACTCYLQKQSGSENSPSPVCTPVNSVVWPSSTSTSPSAIATPPIKFDVCTNAIPLYEVSNIYIECLPEEDPFNPCEELLSANIRPVIWIVITVTLLGNGMVILSMMAYQVFFRLRQKQLQVVNFLYLNLAGADFLMGMYLFIIGTEDLITHYGSPGAFFTQAPAWQSGRSCSFAGFCVMTSISMSVFTLVLITVERVHSIVHVFHHKKISLKLAAVLVSAGWVYALVMGLLPLGHVSSYGKTALCLPLDTSNPASAGYVYFTLISTGIASIVIAISYIIISCNIFCKRELALPANASRINEYYVGIRMSIIVLSNFACWLPIAVVALATASGQNWIDVSDAKIFMVVVLPLNASLNPVIYTISTRVFRETLMMMSRKCGFSELVSRFSTRSSQQNLQNNRRLSLSKTSTTDLFASSSSSRSTLTPGDPAQVELVVVSKLKTLCATNVASLGSIREVSEFEDLPDLVIRNDGDAQYESVMAEESPESAPTETSFGGIIENRARLEE